MPPSRAPERLRRLLVLVPYVISHPGTEVAELVRLFNSTEADLLADLQLLFVSGLPPYEPGDLIDVVIEDGRVWVSMADYLSRPLRLTRYEAFALYVRGKALMAVPGLTEAPALAGALSKLESQLGGEELGELAGRVEYSTGSAAEEIVEQLREAAADSESIEIEYYSASSDQIRLRRVDPEEVFAAIGHWYTVAWDQDANAERVFRADRIKSLSKTGERFEKRGLPGAGRPLFESSPDDSKVKLRLRPAARWVPEYYPAESVEERGEDLEVTIVTGNLAWVEKLLLRLGSSASVISPVPELTDRVRQLAARTLARYH